MKRYALMHVVVLGLFTLVSADIALVGTVKKSGTGTPVAGVKIQLAGHPELSVNTGADGSFKLSDVTSVLAVRHENVFFGLTFKNNRLVFSLPDRTRNFSMELIDAGGRKVYSQDLGALPAGMSEALLPDLASGIYLLRAYHGTEALTYTIVCSGNSLLLSKNMVQKSQVDLVLKAASAPVDTLVASKSGFTTKKVPVASYLMNNIVIELDSLTQGATSCSREDLNTVAEMYVKALEAGDPKQMVLTDDIKYFENMKSCKLDSGIWKSKLKVDFHRNIIDADSCLIFVEVIVNNAHPYIIGGRLMVKNGKVAEIRALVSDVGDWLLDDAKDITNAYNMSKGEDWSIIPVDKRDTRKAIQAGGDAYLDAFLDSTKVTVPWGKPCARLEGGAYTAKSPTDQNGTCNVGVPQNLKITDRLYVIDVELGTVQILCKFGGSMPDSHLFRLVGGKLRFVHTISICGEKGCM